MKKILMRFVCGISLISVQSFVGYEVEAADRDDQGSKFKEEVNKIFYSKNSKISPIIGNDGTRKTMITLEVEEKSIVANSYLEQSSRTFKEKSAAIYSLPIEKVSQKRSAYFSRGLGNIEDTSGTVKGVVKAKISYLFKPIGDSGVTYYGMEWAVGQFYPSMLADTSGRRIHYGQEGLNADKKLVRLQKDQYPEDINYVAITYQPDWISNDVRISSLFGGMGVSTYATYTIGEYSDDVSVTVSPF